MELTYLSRGERRTMDFTPLGDRELYLAPDRVSTGSYVYVVTRDRTGLYIEGFRAVAADFVISAAYQVTLYGPCHQEGIRAWFAGRQHNMGGGFTIPGAYRVERS